MSHLEYDLLRQERPDLLLPPWEQVNSQDSWARNYTRERTIAELTAFALAHNGPYFGNHDADW